MKRRNSYLNLILHSKPREKDRHNYEFKFIYLIDFASVIFISTSIEQNESFRAFALLGKKNYYSGFRPIRNGQVMATCHDSRQGNSHRLLSDQQLYLRGPVDFLIKKKRKIPNLRLDLYTLIIFMINLSQLT